MATPIPELLFRELITTGFTWLKANASVVDTFLVKYDEKTRASIKNYFSTNPIEIVQGWPNSTTRFPCISIVLHQETEQEFLGEVVAQDAVDANDPGLQEGRLWTSRYLLTCISENGDLTLFLYQLLKFMLQKFLYILKQDMVNISFEGGDLQPNLDFLPDKLFMRGLTISGSYLSTVQQDYGAPISQVVIDMQPTGGIGFVLSSQADMVGRPVITAVNRPAPDQTAIEGVVVGNIGLSSLECEVTRTNSDNSTDAVAHGFATFGTVSSWTFTCDTTPSGIYNVLVTAYNSKGVPSGTNTTTFRVQA